MQVAAISDTKSRGQLTHRPLPKDGGDDEDQDAGHQRQPRQVPVVVTQMTQLKLESLPERAHCGQSNRTLIPGRNFAIGVTGRNRTSKVRTS